METRGVDSAGNHRDSLPGHCRIVLENVIADTAGDGDHLVGAAHHGAVDVGGIQAVEGAHQGRAAVGGQRSQGQPDHPGGYPRAQVHDIRRQLENLPAQGAHPQQRAQGLAMYREFDVPAAFGQQTRNLATAG